MLFFPQSIEKKHGKNPITFFFFQVLMFYYNWYSLHKVYHPFTKPPPLPKKKKDREREREQESREKNIILSLVSSQTKSVPQPSHQELPAQKSEGLIHIASSACAQVYYISSLFLFLLNKNKN